jgi:hypothetical protein
VAAAIVMALSLGFVGMFDFPTFAGPVAFYTLGLIPMQIVVAVLWGANPSFAAGFRQPIKGLVLILVTAAASAVLSPLALALTGEGVNPPGPIPSHYVILVVPITFWLAIMFGGWPFTSVTKNPIVAGLLLLVVAYLATYAIFRMFFSYDFLQGEPVYLASAPRGLYNALTVLVFLVTMLGAMFVVLCFDLWPLTKTPALMKQPVLGVAWTLLAAVVAGLAVTIGLGMMGDPLVFLTRVTAPFIFGTIIVLNMLQNSLYAKHTQPVKGVLNTLTAIVVGVALANLFGALAPVVTGSLASGPPGYEYEVWLANALLSATFPFLIYHAAFLEFWPLGSRQ